MVEGRGLSLILISFDYVSSCQGIIILTQKLGMCSIWTRRTETTHRTIFLLYNLEFPVHPQLSFDTGFGIFISKVGGDGHNHE